MFRMFRIFKKRRLSTAGARRTAYVLQILQGSLIFSSILLLSSCSIRGFVVKQTQPIIEETQKAVLLENEESIAKGSLEFAIKFSEGLYRYYPKSPYYSGKLALLYSAYAFAFVDKAPYSDFDDTADDYIQRSIFLYEKAMEYGFKSMNTRISDFEASMKSKDAGALKEALMKVREKDSETLFWLNFAWAMKIFLDLSDVSALADLEAVYQIALRLNELSPDYLDASVLSILIAYYGARSDVIGGSRSKADEYYKMAMAQSKERLLIADYVYLRFVLTQERTAEAFDTLTKKIEQFDLKKNPSLRFINVFLKRKTKELVAKKAMFF